MQRRFTLVLRFVLLIVILSGLTFQPSKSALAAANLVVSPLTWNIIGLDSNNPTVGPYRFPVGARACNPGSNLVTMSDVEADFVWLSGGTTNDDSVIQLRPGSLDPIAPNPQIDLAPGSCYDFYFEVEVNRFVPSPYNQTRRYRIDIRYDDPEIAGIQTVSSATPRELFVEHLISQSRNAITDVELNGTSIPAGGSMNLLVGNTYTITLEGGTATQGYNQFEAFINFPNTIFQILSVSTDYSANDSPYVSTNDHDQLYADACLWENDPNSPNYRSCVGGDYKSGGSNVVTTYVIKIIGGGGTTQTLNTLLYDFSGSSYHYNADYSLGARFANIVDPTNVTIEKSFSPNPTNVNGISALTITLTNPNPGAISGYNFVDPLPDDLAVASPPNATTTSCGTPTFAPVAGADSISFSDGTIAANGSCTIKVNVTPSITGSFVNTTDHLFVDLLDTGQFATSTLTVNTTPPLPTPPSSCTTPVELARWTMDPSQGTSVPPDEFSSAADVDDTQTAASYTTVSGTNSISTTGSPTANSWAGRAPTAGTGWSETPTSMSNYFQFVVDTDNYGGVYATFDAGLFPNGDWANPTSNIYVNTSANGGAFTTYQVSPGVYPQANKGTWTSGLTASAASTGSDYTTFRFGVDGASKTTAEFRLDDVIFYGCERLDPPAIEKGFSPNPIAEGGTSILTFTLTNPNADPLAGLTFTDTLPTGVTLASTPTTTCGGPVTGTAGGSTIDLTGGNLTGTIAVTNGSATVTGTGTNFLNELAAGRILLIDSVKYTISAIASNTSLTLSAAYTGTTASGLTVSGQLAGGGTCTVTATVTSSTAGAYQNVSGFVSSSNGGTNSGSTGSASASLTVIQPASIDKLFSPNPILAGETSTLTFTVTNPNQNDTLTGVTFTDTFPTSPGAMIVASPLVTTLTDCGAGSLQDNSGGALSAGDPGVRLTGATIAAGGTCTVEVAVTVPGTPTSGTYTNTSDAVSSSNGGTGNTATDTLTVNAPDPSIAVYKQVGPTNSGAWSSFLGVNLPGSVYYKFTVENTGDVALSSIDVADPTLGALGCTWPASLPVAVAANDNHIATCVVGPVTASSGSNTNTATASGTYNSTTYQSAPSSATYASQSIELVKTALDTSFTAVNDTVDYSYTVSNNGSYPLSGPVTVSDDKITAPNSVACPSVSTVGDLDDWLDPGESVICTATYTIVASDVSAGSVTNTASATVDSVASNTDSETVYGTTDLAVTKDNGVTSVTSGGTTTYTIRVTNNGPSGVTGAILSDPAAVGLTKTAVACSVTPGQCVTAPDVAQLESGAFALPTLANGQFYEITVTAAVDAASGNVTNTVTIAPPAGGSDPDLTDNTASDTDPVTLAADLTITKTNNTANGWIASGGTFQWTVTARNGAASATASFADGDVILSDTLPAGQSYAAVTVTNGTPAPTGTIDCSITGTTLSCAANGAVTLPADASFSVSFNVTTAGSANLPNTATVDPGSKVSESNEGNNTGSNTVYVFDAQPSKLLVITSEPSTSAARVTIGEMVRYRIAARIPEGDFANFQLVDNIPSGLQFVNDGTARFAFVSNGAGVTSSTLTCTNDTGNAFDLVSLTSTNVDCALTGAISGGTGNGVAVTFSLGNLSNADVDADAEYAVVEFNALVLNVTSALTPTINQGTNNQTGTNVVNNRQNDVTLRVNSTTVGSNSANVTVNIAEPAITNVAKSVSAGPYSPGDAITYTLTFSNVSSSNTNAATAFDIVLTDTLDANLNPGTVNISSTQTDPCIGGSAFTTSDSTSGQDITVNVSCLDPDESVTVTIGATINVATPGGTSISNTGNVTYSSLPGAQGSCSASPFTCTGVGASGSGTGERNGSDGAGADTSVLNNYSDSGTVSFTVTSTDLLPVAAADTNTAAENGPAVNGDVLANEVSLGDTPTTVTAADQGGTAITIGSAFTTTAGGSLTLNGDGTYTYTPPATLPEGATLTEVFNYTITDADGDTSSSTLTITVDRLPEANPDTNNATEGGADVNGNVITNDDEGNVNASVTAADQGGTTITIGSAFTTAAAGSLTLNADGSYTYTPPAINLVPSGGLTEVFNYTITDNDGDTSSSTLTITVDDSDRIPVAVANTNTATENGPSVNGDVLADDSLGDTPTTVTNVVDDDGDPLTLGTPFTTDGGGSLTINSDGTYTYTPPAWDLVPPGGLVEVFSYTITDVDGDTDTTTLTISVGNSNRLPVATDNTYTINEGATASGNVMTDGTPDTLGDPPTTVTSYDAASANGGTVSMAADGSFTYNPNGYVGTDTFTYTITDTDGDTSTATVTINVDRSRIGIAKRIVSTTEISPGTYDVTYDIYVENFGTTVLNNVQVSDDLSTTFAAPTTFTVQSLTSADFTVNAGYDGNGDANLLAGTDSLAAGANGNITLVVRVVPVSAGPFNNTAISSGQCPTCATAVSDDSQDGSDPDPDNDGDPTNDDDPTPLTFGPNLFDPPFGLKVVDASGLPLLQWTMVWINDSNIVAIDAQVSDPIPAGTSFVAGSLTCTASGVTTTNSCFYELPSGTYPRGRVIWNGDLGPDLGATGAASAANEITITFHVDVSAGITSVQNTASIDADLNGNNSITDPGEQIVASASSGWSAASTPSNSARTSLPATGFAPDVVTDMSSIPQQAYTATGDVVLEIPSLRVKLPVVGVPKKDGTWNVAWLGHQAGWLEGTAFPSWSGNSVLTSHVYLSNGLPGPFVNLGQLKFGDKIVIHAYGQKYTFEVRENLVVEPNDLSVMKHEEKSWLTLVTCKEYDAATNTYRKRVVIRAVLVSVAKE